MTLEYVVKQHGMTPGVDVIFDDSIQFSAMAGAFISGTGDYVALFEPTASSLEAEGAGFIVASVGAESGEIPYTAYFAQKSFIEKNEELIQSFTNAIAKGLAWVQRTYGGGSCQGNSAVFPGYRFENIGDSGAEL